MTCAGEAQDTGVRRPGTFPGVSCTRGTQSRDKTLLHRPIHLGERRRAQRSAAMFYFLNFCRCHTKCFSSCSVPDPPPTSMNEKVFAFFTPCRPKIEAQIAGVMRISLNKLCHAQASFSNTRNYKRMGPGAVNGRSHCRECDSLEVGRFKLCNRSF